MDIFEGVLLGAVTVIEEVEGKEPFVAGVLGLGTFLLLHRLTNAG